MLLLLQGAGSVVAAPDGVRAYATVYFSNVNETTDSLSLVNPTTDTLADTTNAYPTEE